MNKQGFTIIELLVAMVVASMIAVVLVQTLGLVNRVSMAADDRMTTDERAMVIFAQFERDLSGAFVPASKQEKEDETKKETEKKGEAKPTRAEEKPAPKITKVFVGDAHCTLLTFITNNPLPTYWDARVGKAPVAIARVVYRLVEDKKLKGTYTLMRLETDDVHDEAPLQKEKLGGFVTVATGIKEMKLKFIEQKDRFPKKEKAEGQAPKPAAGPQPAAPAKKTEPAEPMPIIEYSAQEEWDTDKEPEEQKEVIRHRLPAYVQVQLTLWDNRRKAATLFDYTCQLVPDIVAPKKKKPGAAEEEKAPAESEKPTAKPTRPGGGNGSVTPGAQAGEEEP